MSKLIIVLGLPASGKTTWTRGQVLEDPKNRIRVNRDSLREGMFEWAFYLKGVSEEAVIKARDSLVRTFLKANKEVYVDDTFNFRKHNYSNLLKIAKFFGAEVEIKKFDVPIDVCIERDAKRERPVGEKVIKTIAKEMFKDGAFPEIPLDDSTIGIRFNRYVPNLAMPRAVIFDIDGTLASHEGVRSPYDYTKVIQDKPRHEVIAAAAVYHQMGYKIIILSGRDGSCRPDTEKWLNRELVYPIDDGGIESIPYTLFMRTAGDKRQDRIIKGEIFDQHIREFYNVEVVFDDRDQVVELWRLEFCINCFQVNYGNF